jgi:hypothetical protein
MLRGGKWLSLGLIVAGGSLELPDTITEAFHELRNLSGAEEEHHKSENYQDFGGSQHGKQGEVHK